MKLAISSVLLLALTTSGVQADFLRNLQSVPPPPPLNGTNGTKPANGTMPPPGMMPPGPPPKKYGENITIPFNATLGCGACIRANYIYCIPGAEGSDPSTWGTVNKAVCCKDKASCAQISNKAYNCSSQYTDTMMAKALCPFRKNACGNNTAFDFSKVGQSQNINITLPIGETCTFQIQAECGLPAFKPNDTTGFDIETIDYDDDDIGTVQTTKAQQVPPPPPQNSTNGTKPANGTMPPPPPQNGTNGTKPANGTQPPPPQGGQNGMPPPPPMEFGTDKRPPQPPKNIQPLKQGQNGQPMMMNMTGGQGGPQGQGQPQGGPQGAPVIGPQAKRYDPETDGRRLFKGGAPNGANDTLCKKRYQQISVTALGNLATSSSRLLQSTTNTSSSTSVSMTLTVGTEDFSSSSSGAISTLFFKATTFTLVVLSFLFI